MSVQLSPLPSKERISLASGRYGTTPQELRLDVSDGNEPFPQRLASGNFTHEPDRKIHWVADDLTPIEGHENSWIGTIRYTEPKVDAFQGSEVTIWLSGELGKHLAHIGFGADSRSNVISLDYQSPKYRQMAVTFAAEEGEDAVIDIPDTNGGSVSIPTVFQRAGFDVTWTDDVEPVTPVRAAQSGDPKAWSDKELHDAMQDYWATCGAVSERGIWVFFASSYQNKWAGAMFDMIGPPFRQGCAIFSNGQAIKDSSERQGRFIEACHEIGHCLNLVHSNRPMRGAYGIEEWFETKPEPTVLSFMRGSDVPLTQEELTAFKYRFSGHDQAPHGRDLAFLRHAPEQWVYPSEIPFMAEESALQGTQGAAQAGLKLEVNVNRDDASFEFMEPVTLELKLTNTSADSIFLDDNPLVSHEDMTVIIRRDSEKSGHLFWPYVRYCRVPRKTKEELGPGKALYEPLFISAGVKRGGGWFISDPGTYTIQVVVHVNDIGIQSKPLQIQVLPPRGDDAKDQEGLAGRFFSDEVGRIIAFHGSRFSTKGNDCLEEVKERLKRRRVAIHAAWALGKSVAYRDKRLHMDQDGNRRRFRVRIDESQPDAANERLRGALMAQDGIAVESFGHINYRRCADFLSKWLCEREKIDAAVETQEILYQTMSSRKVGGRPILPSVLEEIGKRRDYLREHRKWPSPQMLAGEGPES